MGVEPHNQLPVILATESLSRGSWTATEAPALKGAISALLVSRSDILPVNPRVSRLKNNGPSPIAKQRDRAITRKTEET